MVTSTLAAVIWPANFVSASRPQRSSIRPIGHDQPAGDDDRGHAGRVDESAGQRGQLGCQQHGGDHPDVHRQPTHPRGRLHVHIAFPRVGHGAEPGGQHPDPAGREVGDDRGGQADERELAQRDTGAAVGERQRAVATSGTVTKD